MFRSFLISILLLAASAAASSEARAAFFADVINFSDSSGPGFNYTTVTEEALPLVSLGSTPNWTHDITDNLGGSPLGTSRFSTRSSS